jgi:hypothetical protein
MVPVLAYVPPSKEQPTMGKRSEKKRIRSRAVVELEALRVQAGLNKREWKDVLGISYRTYMGWLSGRTEKIDHDKVAAAKEYVSKKRRRE